MTTKYLVLVLCYLGNVYGFIGLITHYKHESTHKEVVLMATCDDMDYQINRDVLTENRRNVIEFLEKRVDQHWSVFYESGAYTATGLYEYFLTTSNRLINLIGNIQKSLAVRLGDRYQPFYDVQRELSQTTMDAVPHNERIKECISADLSALALVNRFDADPYVLAHTIRLLADIVIPSYNDQSGRSVVGLLSEEEFRQSEELFAQIFCIMTIALDSCCAYLREASHLQNCSIYQPCLKDLEELRAIVLERSMPKFVQWLNYQNIARRSHLVLISLFNMFALGHITATPGNIIVVTDYKRIKELSVNMDRQGFVKHSPVVYEPLDGFNANHIEQYMQTLFSHQSESMRSDSAADLFAQLEDFSRRGLFVFDNGLLAQYGSMNYLTASFKSSMTEYEKREYLISLIKSTSNFVQELQFLEKFLALSTWEAERLVEEAFFDIDSSLLVCQLLTNHAMIRRVFAICDQFRAFWLQYGEKLVLDPVQFFENPVDHIKNARVASIQNIAAMDPDLLKKVQELMREALECIESTEKFLKLYERVKQLEL